MATMNDGTMNNIFNGISNLVNGNCSVCVNETEYVEVEIHILDSLLISSILFNSLCSCSLTDDKFRNLYLYIYLMYIFSGYSWR